MIDLYGLINNGSSDSSNQLLETWILKNNKNDLMGYYEIEKHENKEFELINMGILREYDLRVMALYFLIMCSKIYG